MRTPNQLVNELYDAAVGIAQDMATGEKVAPSFEFLDRLYLAVNTIEQATVIDGVWRLERR